MNSYRGVLDFKFALPLVIAVLISTPIGAYLSQFVNHKILMWMLVAFINLSSMEYHIATEAKECVRFFKSNS